MADSERIQALLVQALLEVDPRTYSVKDMARVVYSLSRDVAEGQQLVHALQRHYNLGRASIEWAETWLAFYFSTEGQQQLVDGL